MARIGRECHGLEAAGVAIAQRFQHPFAIVKRVSVDKGLPLLVRSQCASSDLEGFFSKQLVVIV